VETRGAIAFVIRGVRGIIGKAMVRWDVTCGLGSKAEEGQSVKVGAQVLCRFKEVAVLEVVMGNVHV